MKRAFILPLLVSLITFFNFMYWLEFDIYSFAYLYIGYKHSDHFATADLKRHLDAQSPKFGQASVFLSTMKAIMAKLYISDWSSLDDSMVRIRVSTLRFFIKKAIAWGAEEIEPTIEFLKV